jgi:hypothetical protein
VSLVEDKDLVAVASRGKDRAFTKFAGVIDTVVTGGVDLDNIE